MRKVKIEVIIEAEDDISNDEFEDEIIDNLSAASFEKVEAKNIEE